MTRNCPHNASGNPGQSSCAIASQRRHVLEEHLAAADPEPSSEHPHQADSLAQAKAAYHDQSSAEIAEVDKAGHPGNEAACAAIKNCLEQLAQCNPVVLAQPAQPGPPRQGHPDQAVVLAQLAQLQAFVEELMSKQRPVLNYDLNQGAGFTFGKKIF